MNVIFIVLIVGAFLMTICAPRKNESKPVNSAWEMEDLQRELSKQKNISAKHPKK